MYDKLFWLRQLKKYGFVLKRTNGGHARYCAGSVNVDLPIHKHGLSRNVVASLKRAIDRSIRLTTVRE